MMELENKGKKVKWIFVFLLGLMIGIRAFSPSPVAAAENQTAADFNQLKTLMETPNKDYQITITQDIEFADTIQIPASTTVTLTANSSVKLTLQNGFSDRHIMTLGVLHLSSNNITLNGANASDKASGGGILARENGAFYFSGGTIEKCKAKVGGGLQFVDNASLSMTGGTIKDCEADPGDGSAFGGAGGGIAISTGGKSQVISGGKISNCTAHLGGGIYVNDAIELQFEGNA